MKWHRGVEQLTPHIVQIETPQGSGTGFFLARATTTPLCAFATAAHVVHQANYWEQPLRIRSVDSGETALLRPPDRAIFLEYSQDTAVVVFDPEKLSIPTEPFGLIDEGMILKVGVSIGWIGFPAIPGADLCFFTGAVSAWLDEPNAYFVDGVAINGVSGGPAFYCPGDDVKIIGVVSAYMPNRATGESLPGLAIVRHVTQLQEIAQRFQSLEEAKAEETRPVEAPPPPPAGGGDVPGGTRGLL